MNITSSSVTVFLEYNVLRLIVWIIVCIAIPGNIFVITQMILKLKRNTLANQSSPIRFSLYSKLNIKKNPALFILFNLAIADLLGGIYLLVLIMGDLVYTSYYNNILAFNSTNNISIIANQWVKSGGCLLARFLGQVTILMQASMSLFIAINRYRSVYSSYSRRTKIRIYRLLVAICWIISIAIASFVTLWSIKVLDGRSIRKFSIIRHICAMDKGLGKILRAIGFSELFLGCSCYISVIVLYLKISVRLKRSHRQFVSGILENINREIQILSAVIVLTDVIAFIAVTTFSLLFLQPGLIKWNEIMAIMLVLLYANTAIDPIIYIFFRSTTVRSTISWLNIRMAQLRPQFGHSVQLVRTAKSNSGSIAPAHVGMNS